MEPVRRADGSSAGKVAPQSVQRGTAELDLGSRDLGQDAAVRLDRHPPVSIAVAGSFLAWVSSGPYVLQSWEGGLSMCFSFASSRVQSFIRDTLSGEVRS